MPIKVVDFGGCTDEGCAAVHGPVRRARGARSTEGAACRGRRALPGGDFREKYKIG